jgi:small subunit ribosomal protein S17
MADEPDNDTPPQDADPPAAVEGAGDPAAEATEATEVAATADAEAPAADAPEADASPTDASPTEADTPGDSEPDAAAAADSEPESAAAEETETDSAAAEVAASPARPAAPASEPGPQLSAKERRRAARSKHVGEPRPARSPEERHAERLQERKRKAVRRRARRLQERAKAAQSKQAQGTATAGSGELAPVHAPVEGTRRVRQGIVVSDRAKKTITVRIDVARRHRRYQKIVRSSSTLHAHDENNDAHEGDVVRVIESRPLSRTKRWKLVDVLERAR